MPSKCFIYVAMVPMVFCVFLGGCHGIEQPRLTKAQAVNIAGKVSFPDGWKHRDYAYRGYATYCPAPLRQWGVSYDRLSSAESRAIGTGFFVIWIDDITGKFAGYSFDR